MATAVSGLTASSMWMDAIASNIANARDESPVPPTPPSQPVPQTAGGPQTYYQPITVTTKSIASGPNGAGGVASQVTPTLPSYTTVYDPQSPSANAQGVAAMPNVDLATQFVDATMAMMSYRANLAVIKTANQMAKATLDMLA